MDIEKAKERYKRLGESIRKAENAQAQKNDRALTRKKILVGACVMSKDDQYQALIKSDYFDKFLTKNRDRSLFGLKLFEEKPKDATPQAETQIEKTESAGVSAQAE